jgi:hypothetical protein
MNIKVGTKEENNKLTDLLVEYAKNIEDPVANFRLANFYESIGHNSSAVSFYLRCAGRSTDDKILQYSALVGAAKSYEREGYRHFTVTTIMRNALMIDLERPEAYYYFALLHENKAKTSSDPTEMSKNWHDCYMYSTMGTKFCNKSLPHLYVKSEYPGYFGLIFMRGLSSWHCGMPEQAIELFKVLLNDYRNSMSPQVISIVEGNKLFFENELKKSK